MSQPGSQSSFGEPAIGALPKLTVDPGEVARLLGVCTREFRRLRSRGLVPEPEFGPDTRRPRWSLDNLRDWINAGCPTAERWRERLRGNSKGVAR